MKSEIEKFNSRLNKAKKKQCMNLNTDPLTFSSQRKRCKNERVKKTSVTYGITQNETIFKL